MKRQLNVILSFLTIFLTVYFFIIGAEFPETEKNPFKNCFPVEHKNIEPVSKEVKTKEPLDISKYNLTGVVWGDYEARAVINNKIYKVGEKLDGATITSIGKKGVMLDYEGEKYTLITKNYGGGG